MMRYLTSFVSIALTTIHSWAVCSCGPPNCQEAGKSHFDEQKEIVARHSQCTKDSDCGLTHGSVSGIDAPFNTGCTYFWPCGVAISIDGGGASIFLEEMASSVEKYCPDDCTNDTDRNWWGDNVVIPIECSGFPMCVGGTCKLVE